ncbi:MAG TPA: hypothetical protein VGL05_18940, partial [Kribbella sp.]
EVTLVRVWARESGGWYGYVTYLQRHPLNPGRWAHSSALRPLSEDEIQAFSRHREGWNPYPEPYPGR